MHAPLEMWLARYRHSGPSAEPHATSLKHVQARSFLLEQLHAAKPECFAPDLPCSEVRHYATIFRHMLKLLQNRLVSYLSAISEQA